MKFVHLADLHIGKRVNEFSLLEDQRYIFAEILKITAEEKADAVIIAGDVYDKSVPAAEAVSLFDEFLTALAALQVKVFIISGNHDSAERIAFGADLIKGCGIYVAPVFNGFLKSVTLSDQYGEINIYLMPFLKPAYVRRYFPDTNITNYNDAVKTVVENLEIDDKKRNILVAHQFITGAETAGSEELTIGGLENVDVRNFSAFDYVALGHIHRCQAVKRKTIRYAGTPLKYSFSEINHKKTVTIVDLKSKSDIEVFYRNLTPLRDLREIKGSFEQVMQGNKSEDYIHIVLTDEEEIPDVIGKIRSLYPNTMKVDYDNTRTRSYNKIDSAADIEQKSEIELFSELYQMQNGKPMSQEQSDFLLKLIEDLKEV
jgi:exonuclease SbcD